LRLHTSTTASAYGIVDSNEREESAFQRVIGVKGQLQQIGKVGTVPIEIAGVELKNCGIKVRGRCFTEL